MKKLMLFTVMLILTLTLASCKKTEKIIIYSSAEEFRNEDLRLELKKEFPDLNIVVEYYPTGNNAAKLKNEGSKTKADIVLGLDSMYVESLSSMFEELPDFDFSKYEPELVPESKKYVPWDRYSGAIVVNTKVLSEKGLPEPTSYEDLLNPVYNKQIVMSNPKTSGTGYQFLLQFVNAYGEDEAFQYIDGLSKNILQFVTSGSGPVNSLVRGEVAVGLGMTFHTVIEINNGAPLKIIYDDMGAPFSTTSSAIVKGKLEKDNVKEVFDYLNKVYKLRDMEIANPEKIFIGQEDPNIPNFPSITYGNMDGISDLQLKERLLEKWVY